MNPAFLHPRIVAVLLCSILPTAAGGQFEPADEAFGTPGDGKAAFADFNGDGWVDLYAGGRLHRNERGNRFVPAQDAGLPGGEGIWGDFDNDGHIDLFIFTGTGSLHRNLGDGTFEAVEFPSLPTVNARAAVWFDIDCDGLLDLYVGGYEVWQQRVHPDVVYRNEGNGAFRELWRSDDNACYSARGVTAADFNNDGLADVFVSNYRLQPNFLWRNAGGELAQEATEFGVAGIPNAVIRYTGGISYPICGHTIGSAWGDLDDDGWLDLFVGNFSHPPADQDRPQFLRNGGPATGYRFQDRSEHAGLAWQESFASPALGDYDNDGDLDLFFTTVYATGSGGIRNHPVLYRNDGDWQFTNVTEEEGLANLGPTYQAAWADVNQDGFLDLCTNGRLFLNRARGSHWIALDLQGDGDRVNRSAMGATVRIRHGDRVLTRHVDSATGEGNQNDLRLHFGLGSEVETVTAEVTWPGGAVERFVDLAVDRCHRLSRGGGEP